MIPIAATFIDCYKMQQQCCKMLQIAIKCYRLLQNAAQIPTNVADCCKIVLIAIKCC